MPIDAQELLGLVRRRGDFVSPKDALTGKTLPEPDKVKEETVPDFELDDDGEEYIPVGVNGLLASTEKLLAMNRGLVGQDERDSLRYQKVIRPAGLFRERVKMDSGKIARTIMYRAAKTKSLAGLLPGAFDGYIDAVMRGNPLTSPFEEINPMQIKEGARRITKMGPGGIPSSDSITEEAQAVHPSQFGFIDPISGPECLVDDRECATSVLTDKGSIRIRELTVDHKVLCRAKDGTMRFEHPSRVVHKEYKGDLFELDGSCWNERVTSPCMIVTPTHRVVTVDKESGKWAFKTAEACVDSGIQIGIPTLTGDVEWFDTSDWTVHNECVRMVHCCTVPGGMFCVSVNGSVPFWTGNSERAGVDVRAAYGTRVGSDGRIYQKFYDRKSKTERWMNPSDIADLVVKLPD